MIRQYRRKYNIDMLGEDLIRANIHPMCPIEEYASMVRIWDWFNPITPPIMALLAALSISRRWLSVVIVNEYTSRAKGASFCHVDRVRAVSHEDDDITDGYQKWHGALPSFNIREIININWAGKMLVRFHIDKLLRRRRADPRAWDRKYFTAASASRLVFVMSINGINLSRFSSIEAQIISQLVLARAIRTLVIMIIEESERNGDIWIIKAWRSRTPK